MNFEHLECALIVGWALVVMQLVTASLDHHMTRRELFSHDNFTDWSAMEHGGLWVDALIIVPLVSYAVSKYGFDLFSSRGLWSLAGTVLLVLGLVEFWRRNGVETGDHCTHDGHTVPAGWIHGLFAFVAIWVFSQIFLGWTTPIVSRTDILIFSVPLTPFWYLSLAKFSEEWTFDTFAKGQVAVGVVGLWIVTGIRLWYS